MWRRQSTTCRVAVNQFREGECERTLMRSGERECERADTIWWMNSVWVRRATNKAHVWFIIESMRKSSLKSRTVGFKIKGSLKFPTGTCPRGTWKSRDAAFRKDDHTIIYEISQSHDWSTQSTRVLCWNPLQDCGEPQISISFAQQKLLHCVENIPYKTRLQNM